MKKMFLLMITVISLFSCDLDGVEGSGYDFEFVFFNPAHPEGIVISPTYKFEDGSYYLNGPDGIYNVQWQCNGSSFTVDFTANEEDFQFLWIEEWKTQHPADVIPWVVQKQGEKYHITADTSYLRNPANGYYRFDVQRLNN